MDLDAPPLEDSAQACLRVGAGRRNSIIVLTGHDERGLAGPVRSLGASAFLRKPVDEAARLAALRTDIAPDSGCR